MGEIIVTPLGTVSPYPKGEMNCPGFLVEYNNHKILLDCGNGITRLLPFPEILDNLHVIITHYHKDHFSDIGAIQYASFVYHNMGMLKNRVKVYLPQSDYKHNYEGIVSNRESYTEYIEISDDTTIKLDDLKVSFEDNDSHTIESYMVKLQNPEHEIVYTSDIGTTNFDRLISFCRNSDLIICESSFLRKHNSNSKTHMTAYAAGELARESGTKKLLLTHFWPEEDKQLYLAEAQENFPNTEVAEEGKKLVLRRPNKND